MKYLHLLLLSLVLLSACQGAASTSNSSDPSQVTQTAPAAPAPDSQESPAATTAAVTSNEAGAILSLMRDTMLSLTSLEWDAHITGSFTSTNPEQIITETRTSCSLSLPNTSYCVTQELIDGPGEVSETPIELLQIGTDQYILQASGWEQLSGTDRPRSIILHELFRIQNGQLFYIAGDYITAAEISGQETLNGVETTIVSVQYDAVAYDLYATWYGSDVVIPDAQHQLTSKLWIGQDGRLHQSESTLETAVQGETTRLVLETSYESFNQPLELPQP